MDFFKSCTPVPDAELISKLSLFSKVMTSDIVALSPSPAFMQYKVLSMVSIAVIFSQSLGLSCCLDSSSMDFSNWVTQIDNNVHSIHCYSV